MTSVFLPELSLYSSNQNFAFTILFTFYARLSQEISNRIHFLFLEINLRQTYRTNISSEFCIINFGARR